MKGERGEREREKENRTNSLSPAASRDPKVALKDLPFVFFPHPIPTRKETRTKYARTHGGKEKQAGREEKKILIIPMHDWRSSPQ